MEPELALALSARGWSDELRRFVADHGGARIRVTALGSEDLSDEAFDVLIIDDICSFLTPRLVDEVRAAGRAVIGVYDPDEFPEGREALHRVGVTDVLGAAAHPEDFLARVGEVAGPTLELRRRGDETIPTATASEAPAGRRLVAVAGPGGGCGVTEVGLALADSLLRNGGSVVLVDGDDLAPSLGQRLGLALHPNVRTAVDCWEQRQQPVTGTLQSRHGLPVLVGMPGAAEWGELRTTEVLGVIEELGETFDHVVVDTGNRPGPDPSLSAALIERADVVIAVCAPTPVGITRLVRWHSRQSIPEGARLEVAVNRATRDPFKRGELLDEIAAGIDLDALAFLPDDPGVCTAAWDGRLVGRGRFRDAVDRLAGSVDRSRR